MIESIFLYKLIAAVLITNSHMGPLYGRFDALAIGGALGNTFFFIASGFLASSKKIPFVPYMKKRILRIWPVVIVVTIIMYILGELPEYTSVLEMVRACIFPTAFWFVNAIIVCYILFYISNFYFEQYQLQVAIGFIFIYLLYYLTIFDLRIAPLESGYGKVLYLFPAMLIGKKIKLSYTQGECIRNWVWGAVMASGTLWLLLQLIAKKYPTMQILVPFSSMAVGTFVLLLLLKYENRIKTLNLRVKAVMHEIANATLEVYLVQVVIIRYMSNQTSMFKIPATYLLIFFMAVTLRKIMSQIKVRN